MAADYAATLKQFIFAMADYFTQNDGVEVQAIVDEERGHYQLARVEWRGENWIYGILMHLDLKDQRIWIQHNATEILIDQELVQLGVPAEAIWIGFVPPWIDQFPRRDAA